MGGYGPIFDGKPDQGSDQMAVDPSPTVKFNGWKSAARDIWSFVRALDNKDPVLPDQWPDDFNENLSEKPKTAFVGCKFYTQFG